ncbi:MAG TPA: hypothetical protein VEH30_15280 [Terriglobales bacterium]|nr:hypothetical protein [Terriglobales bacterium]
MHRQTARLLLIFLLVGIFTPLVLAVSAPVPHACCMRKPLHARNAHDSQLNAPPGCCNHDCCRPQTARKWAHATATSGAQVSPPRVCFNSKVQPAILADRAGNARSVRGPPLSSIA